MRLHDLSRQGPLTDAVMVADCLCLARMDCALEVVAAGRLVYLPGPGAPLPDVVAAVPFTPPGPCLIGYQPPDARGRTLPWTGCASRRDSIAGLVAPMASLEASLLLTHESPLSARRRSTERGYLWAERLWQNGENHGALSAECWSGR